MIVKAQCSSCDRPFAWHRDYASRHVVRHTCRACLRARDPLWQPDRGVRPSVVTRKGVWFLTDEELGKHKPRRNP